MMIANCKWSNGASACRLESCSLTGWTREQRQRGAQQTTLSLARSGSLLVAGGGEEHVSVAAFLVRAAADLAQAEHLEEGDGVLQRTDADHGVQIFGHGCPPVRVFVAARQKGHGVVIRMISQPPDPLRGSAPQSIS